MNIEHVATLYLEDTQQKKIINQTKKYNFFFEWDYPFPSNKNTDKPSNSEVTK